MSIKRQTSSKYVVFALASYGLDGTCVYSDDIDPKMLDTLRKDTVPLGSVTQDGVLTHYLAYKYPAHMARLPGMRDITTLGYLPKSIVESAQCHANFISDEGNIIVVGNAEEGTRTLSQDPTTQNVASICRKLVSQFCRDTKISS